MNCDEAFEVLTRGPFPSGDKRADEAVELHLAACHDCRQLAEALRPAVGLFHEALAASESLSLPGYSGELRPAGDVVIKTLAAPPIESLQKTRASAQHSGRKTAVMTWPLVAAGLAGLAIGMIGASLGNRTASQRATADAEASSVLLVSRAINREGNVLLASLNLPVACREPNGVGEKESTGLYYCCTLCHSAAESATAPEVKLTTLTSSCLVCHADTDRSRAGRPFGFLNSGQQRQSGLKFNQVVPAILL